MVTTYTACFRCWLFGYVLALLLLREVLVREVGGRAAVLDRAGELDRRLQGCTIHTSCCDACGYSNCASVGTWLAGVCVPVLDGLMDEETQA